ncbi:MAG: 2-phospho-L-lactate guanylyltransferase [Gaiellales bacterium]
MIAIVPVNAPERGKRRLASTFSSDQRRELVRTMLADVVDACHATSGLGEVLVASPDPRLAPRGCAVIVDEGRGHAAALGEALSSPPARSGALVVMADCPLVSPATLERLTCSAAPVAVGPAQDGGTNALALRPPDVIEPAFGVSDGARLVAERARAAGVEIDVVHDELLALDLDTPEDARRIAELGGGTATQRLLRTLLPTSARTA